MLRAIVLFVLGSLVTVAFTGGMLFLFGQTNQVNCKHVEPTLVSCSVSSVVLGVLPLPGWKLDHVVNAKVEEDCNDGCSYRVALATSQGQSRPVSEVWTDQEYQMNQMAAQINAFIGTGGAPELVVANPPAAWVIWLLAGLGVMSLVIQGIVLLAQIARALVGPRSAVSGGIR